MNKKTKERVELSGYYYRKVWDKVRKHFDLKLTDGRYLPLHILRHSAIQNIGESMQANIAKFTQQSPKIMEHYLTDETINNNELVQLLAWQKEKEEKLKGEQKEKDRIASKKNAEFLDDFGTKIYNEDI